MRPLEVASSHSSPDGSYVVGTAFANATPSASWAGYVLHNSISQAIVPISDPASTTFSGAFGVNNSGTVVGDRGDNRGPNGSHAIVVSATGQLTDLGSLGGYTAALAINSQGTVVGEGQTSGSFRAFLSDGHNLTDLNTLIKKIPDFLVVSATSINDAGQIAAYGRFASDPTYLYHKVLLSPTSFAIPELLPQPDPSSTPDPSPAPQPSPIPEPTAVVLFAVIAFVGGLATGRMRTASLSATRPRSGDQSLRVLR